MLMLPEPVSIIQPEKHPFSAAGEAKWTDNRVVDAGKVTTTQDHCYAVIQRQGHMD